MSEDKTDRVDAWLEEVLGAEGREHRSAYIADDGFTSSVIGSLPSPVTVPAWRRAVVVALWLIAAIAAVLIVPGLFDQTFRGAVALFVGQRMGLADIVGLLLVVAVMTWGTVVYAIRTD